jgi:hypothetical protein
MRFTPILAAALAFAGDGIAPRNAPADYPAHQDAKVAVIAAIRIPAEQLNRSFPADLGRKYAVVEVAIYPNPGPSMNLSPMDFALRVSDALVRPASAEEVASIWRPRESRPKLPGNTHVTTETGVVMGSHIDPVTGKRVNDAGTYEAVGVSVGEPRQPDPLPSTGVDADRMEARLKTLELPDGKISAPVAGYLFFPLPQKMKKGALELQYARENNAATLTLK